MSKIKIKRLIVLIIICLLFVFFTYFLFKKIPIKKAFEKNITGFISSDTNKVKLYDKDGKEVSEIVRGKEVKVSSKPIVDKQGNKYYKIIDGNLIKIENFTTDNQRIVTETKRYVRTYVTVYKNSEDSSILSTINKGEELDIIGYDKLLDDGSVNKYKIKYDDIEGYVYSKYLSLNKEEALKNYDEEGTYLTHANCQDVYDIGTAKNLDFYPVIKPKFKDNIMPEEVRALYLNVTTIKNIDKYIELAKKSNINAFVVDIKENTSPGYKSEVMKKYSITNYDKAYNSFDEYKSAIAKLKENGFYVIGRISLFKDTFFAKDHPETALLDTSSNTPFLHNGSYWPSGFNRLVWEFNVELAKEAVVEMGFNEIQFDYVRFPDGTYKYENSGQLDMRNTYNEEKAQAIQKFLMYATDEIHNVGAYVSADVFGESAHNYVTGYGQYWAAISNTVDVISAMPYPDHFGPHEYAIKEIVWTVPYKLLNSWGEYVMNRQKSIPTPAILRTWIQGYDAIKNPKIEYDAAKVSEEIKGLYDAGLTGGYMVWNSGSSLSKYEAISDAFRKDYLHE